MQVTINYRTGWSSAFIHYSGSPSWLQKQLVPMPEYYHWQTITLEYQGPFEFVFTNGEDGWDNPSADWKRVRENNYYIDSAGTWAVRHGQLMKVKSISQPILLISDIDGTLYEQHDAARQAATRFTLHWIKYHMFNGSKLVLNTGRELEDVLSIYSEGFDMPQADVIVSWVGSSLYHLDQTTGEYIYDETYLEIFDKDHWDSDIVVNMLEQKYPWLIEPGNRSVYPFKVWRTAQAEDLEEHREEMIQYMRNEKDEMREGKAIQAKVIISGSGSHRYLDFTVMEGGKYAAVTYLQKELKFTPECTLVAGDSGNDEDMFYGEEHGVITANHTEGMAKWIEENMPTLRNKYVSTYKVADAVTEALRKLE